MGSENPDFNPKDLPDSLKGRFYALSQYMPFNKAVDYALNSRYDVAIIGIWSVENYGSNMTYYALYQTIRDMGLEPLMIERPMNSSWKPHEIPEGFKFNPYRAYDLSPIYPTKESMAELNERSDVFLVGSDQLFLNGLYQAFGEYITSDWVRNNKKKAAYAASFGREDFTGDMNTRSTMAHSMQKFDCFSVREKSGVALARDLFGVHADFVLDPVFLCDVSHYEQMAQYGVSQTSGKIMVYMLDTYPWKEDVLSRTSSQLGLESFVFIDIKNLEKSNQPITNAYNEDWLRSILESEFVVADSFHGVCFSIIFRKPFIALANTDRGLTRFESILSLLHLGDRLIFNIEQFDALLPRLTDIDYDAVYEILEKEKVRSMEFLKKAVQPVNKAYSDYDILSAKINSLEADVLGRMGSLEAGFSERVNSLDTSFSGRLETQEQQVASLGASISGRVISLESDLLARVSSLEAGISERVNSLEAELSEKTLKKMLWKSLKIRLNRLITPLFPYGTRRRQLLRKLYHKLRGWKE
ncbi:hypothetical protein FACS189476_01110 [Spirochaetia bacterium]|nr:hypothetical protein FACS189476_01110 [Spirochaetia bacterium]